jgi:serine/threonine-protein kinase HipA
MQCRGCYKKEEQGYCLNCRKKLFEKLRVQPLLSFPAPVAGNLNNYKEHTKLLSISGVQLKYSLVLQDKELAMTNTAGHFILKPIPPVNILNQVESVPENEHLTMQIASQVFGIRTAENAIVYFPDGTPAYITKRFDRRPDGSKYQQEDFAQLTNRSYESHGEHFKYDGTYEEMGQLIKKYVAASIPALETFFSILVFNYVFANGDAHLKNFSLMRIDSGEYTLTPAYDLMCTQIHTADESDTALDLYEGWMESPYYSQYGHYGRLDFEELAKRLGLQEKRYKRIIEMFNQKQDIVLQMIENSFLMEEVKGLYKNHFLERLSRIQ